jgi:phosphatidylglycerol:prolipoprotein diacylglycerol transferase
MFVILWLISAQPRRKGFVSGWFMILYGSFRFIVEFAREPDSHLGFIAFNWLSMGQLLSLPMVLVGVYLLYWSRSQEMPAQEKGK